MPFVINPVTLPQLTEATLTGAGVFDVLMKAAAVHLEDQFKKDRIKGSEYSTVYLGGMEAVLATSIAFLLQKDKNTLDSYLVEQQILLAQIEVQKAQAQLLLLTQSLLKVPAEIALLEAQTAIAVQQKLNLIAEALNIPKQGQMIDAQKGQVTQQIANLTAEGLNIPKQGLLVDAQKGQVLQNTANMTSEKLGIEAKTLLTTAQKANAVVEGTVLVAQECKLRAEFDVLMTTNLKTQQENALLLWKTNTEKAQTLALGVDVDSVIGKQKALYGAQTSGFGRDAEQKAADILIKTWNVRRTTDEATVADATNMLNDTAIGRVVNKMLTGVNA